VLVATDPDGRIVALRAFQRWRWWNGERAIEAVRAVDTATHPDWRGRGLFRRLTLELVERESARGTAFVFNTPNAASGPGYLSMGWRRVGRVPLLVRPLRPLGVLLGSGAGPPDLDELPPVTELLDHPGLDALLERVRTAGATNPRLRTLPTREYLAWRYRDVPGLDYRALRNDRAALVVRGRSRRGRRELSVSEWLVPDDPAAVRAAAGLLRELAAGSTGTRAAAAEADYLAATASPGTPERAAARAAGLLPAPGLGPGLFVRQLATAVSPDPYLPRSWRLVTGALEIF
jgi:GNAT superfamily N-acetyltransferase